MAKDWIGNSRSGMYGLGASNRSDRERESLDFYATPPSAVRRWITKLDELGIQLPKKIWEPAVGMGHIALEFKKQGYDVVASDIVYRGWKGTQIMNFLDATENLGEAIVTNPPYAFGAKFVIQALNLMEQDQYCCMLLKIQFMEGKERAELLYKAGLNPEYILVFPDRINCAKQGNFKGDNEAFQLATKDWTNEDFKDLDEAESDTGGQIAYAWYIWRKGYVGPSKTYWL